MQKKLSFILGGAILALPFFSNPFSPVIDNQLEPPKIYAVFFLGAIFFSMYLWRKNYILSLINAILAFGVLRTGVGVMQVHSYFYTVGALLFATHYREALSSRKLLLLFAYSGLLPAIYAYCQFFGYDPIMTYAPGIKSTYPIAFFGQATKYGAFAAIAASIALGLRKYWLFLIIAGSAVITFSSFTLAALGAGIMICLRRYNYGKKIIIAAFTASSLFAIIGFVFFSESYLFYEQGRFIVWSLAIKSWIHNHFWFGYGPGSFGIFFPELQPQNTWHFGKFIQAHNDYIQVLFEYGLLGGAAIVVAAIGVFKSYQENWWKKQVKYDYNIAAQAGFAAISVNAIGNFPWQLAPHYIIGLVCLSILMENKGPPED